jgi:hypothetical protein
MYEVLAWRKPWGERIPENIKEIILNGHHPDLELIPKGVPRNV